MKTFETQFRIRQSQFDRYGKMKLNAWFDILQEAAGLHANILGVGMEEFFAANRCWVLARIRIAINAEPQPGELVNVLTYPRGAKRLFAERHFAVRDAKGVELMTGSSRWMMLDRTTGRPLSLDPVIEHIPANDDLPQFFDFATKLPTAENFDRTLDIPIRPTMEDINGHLNNAEYIAAAQDTLCSDGNIHDFAGAEISYHYPLRVPDVLHMGIAIDGKTVYFTGVGSSQVKSVSGAIFLR